MVLYQKFVQVGRIAFITHGKYEGKICCIIDVIDQNRVLIDGPCSGVPRMAFNLKKLQLTKYVIKIGHSARSTVVKDKWEEREITQKWNESSWAKKRDHQLKRLSLNDFERFKLKEAKRQRNKIIRGELNKLNKEIFLKRTQKKIKT